MAANAHRMAPCFAISNSSSAHKPLHTSHLPFRKLIGGSDRCGGNRRGRRIVGSLSVGAEDIAQVIHNKVLIAAVASSAIGQLSKPFASALLYGKGFNLRVAAQSGGFPSTHSASVVAAATSIGLERGFSDSIFGLAVVYAAIVMYDAQGVRMEVGKHAQVLNKILLNDTVDEKVEYGKGESTPAGLYPAEQKLKKEAAVGSYNSTSVLAPTLQRQDHREEEAQDVQVTGTNVTIPLKESVGHTKVEVVAGASLGLVIGLAVHAFNIV